MKKETKFEKSENLRICIGISKVPDFFTVALSDGKNDTVDDYLAENDYLSEYEKINAFDIGNDQISIVTSAQGQEGRKYERDGLLYLGTVPGNFLKVFDWDGDGLELKPGEISNVRLDEMGFIFQQMYMLKNLSIYDNILLPAY